MAAAASRALRATTCAGQAQGLHHRRVLARLTTCQGHVSRHAKCYRAIDRRARNRVTHERTDFMGATRVGPQATREYLARMRERYERATRDAKGALLDEVCEVTGYHRKAVIRLLRRARRRGGSAAGPAGRVRPGRRGGVAGDLDGGRLSVVGAAEGAAAARGCRGRAAAAADAGDRASAAPDQCAPDRSAVAAA